MKGVTFGTKHSYKDFGLILTSKDIGLPEPKTEKVDVPGMDGDIDLTSVLTDSVKFKNRKLNFEFVKIGTQSQFMTALEMIANYLHGQKIKIILDDDPKYYYIGRCTIDKFKTDKKTATIAITADAQPYKMLIGSVGDSWVWDTFSFEHDMTDTNIIKINVSGTATVNLLNLKKVVSPTFICYAPMEVMFNGSKYKLKSGEQTVYDIRLKEGDNPITLTGTGTVKIKYEGGVL